MYRYFYVSTSGGLIVLGHRVPTYNTRVFKPLTSAMKCIEVLISVEQVSAVVVMTSPSLRVFISNLQIHTMRWADESSKEVDGHEICHFSHV
jgi:hypothetical protein